MTEFSKTSLSPVDEGPEHVDIDETGPSSSFSDVADGLIISSLQFICIIGLLGNGIVICLLGFHIKRSSFTTYILSLAVADFGVLLFWELSSIFSLFNVEDFPYEIFFMAVVFTYSTSQLLLTAISIDRSVSVLFPIWHRCHRPPRLSTVVCASIWVFSSLSLGIAVLLHNFGDFGDDVIYYTSMAGGILCLPLVTVSTMILLSKVFCRPQQPRRGRVLIIILLALVFFLIFGIPLNAIFALIYFISSDYADLIHLGILCACLNSCVNPAIYYMVGRKKGSRQRQSLKVILQRAFEEEEEYREERGPTAETSL